MLELAPVTPVVSGAVPDAEPVEEEGDFWPTEVGGLIVCGLFAFAAAAISCYQVRGCAGYVPRPMWSDCNTGERMAQTRRVLQIFLHAINYEDPIVQVSTTPPLAQRQPQHACLCYE